MHLQHEQRRTAYHESGHAVAKHQLGWDIHFVAIARIDETGFNWSGAAHGDTKPSPDGAVIAYAGPLAEARIADLSVTDAELTDGRMPAGFADRGAWKGDAAMAKSFAAQNPLGPYVARARSLIGLGAIWHAISSLACELCSPMRLKKIPLRDIPLDVRAEVLLGCDDGSFDGRVAAYSYIRKEEVDQIIRSSLGKMAPAS